MNIDLIVNPLTPIGSLVTHENWPTNWPNFAASPALRGWPACNRHTAACIHRFSHILGWPPEPVVWFMFESRAVPNEHEGYKRTLSIISSSFWMAVGVKGLRIGLCRLTLPVCMQAAKIFLTRSLRSICSIIYTSGGVVKWTIYNNESKI